MPSAPLGQSGSTWDRLAEAKDAYEPINLFLINQHSRGGRTALAVEAL
jgi:hypothetical protein